MAQVRAKLAEEVINLPKFLCTDSALLSPETKAILFYLDFHLVHKNVHI